jgi:hypothetical protein
VFALDWSLTNSSALYMKLSDPCKLLMHALKRIARSKVPLYNLRPGIRSTVNECEFQAGAVAELLHAEPFPPRFTFGVDEFGNLYFLENVVVWHVVLDAIMELQLYNDINSLDSIFCTAAVAVSCALEELATGRFIQNEKIWG